MNGRTLILLVVAIVVVVATVILVRNHSGGTESSGPKVLVASDDIAAGSFIRSDKDLAWIDWPQGTIAPTYITSDAHHMEEFNGAVARRTFGPNEPISTNSIIRSNEGGFMSAVLTPGMRAISIAVSLTSGNAGFVFPGDKVDLLLTHKIMGKDVADNMLASETFVEDVRVLAIDQMLDNPENKAVVAKTITLEVTPKQAEMINVATSLGSISVSLRSLANGSKATSATDPVKPTSTSSSPAQPTGASPALVAPLAPSDAQTALPVPSGNYSTDNDVSRIGNNAHAKVSVFHGSATEQLEFHQEGK